jgi:SsrA-binding protein
LDYYFIVAKPKGKKSEQDPNERSIAKNRKASHNFMVIDTLECGVVLVGSEVKSLRNGKVSIEEAYARVKENEVWLIGWDIAEYTEANQFNHQPKRPRKLLLHRREIKRFATVAFQKGLTLVPLKMYFKEGRAKVLLGLCKGKQKQDKREAMKKAEVQRDLRRQMFRRR